MLETSLTTTTKPVLDISYKQLIMLLFLSPFPIELNKNLV